MVLPLLSAGAGSSIPISAGGGTSGDAVSGASGINIGGLFSKGSQSARLNDDTSILPIAIVGGVLLFGAFMLLRRR